MQLLKLSGQGNNICCSARYQSSQVPKRSHVNSQYEESAEGAGPRAGTERASKDAQRKKGKKRMFGRDGIWARWIEPISPGLRLESERPIVSRFCPYCVLLREALRELLTNV